MTISTVRSAGLMMTVLFIVSASVFARDPLSTASQGSLLPIMGCSTASLTPPPKEWAMFPQDEAPAQAPQAPPPANGQAPAPSNANNAGAKNSGGPITGDAAMGLVSAPVSHSAPRKELPLFWLLVTGALSFGAIMACGGLILRKDHAPAADSGLTEIPVISELQEIKA